MPISLTSLRFGDISTFSDDTTSPSPKPSQTADSDPSAILLPRGTFENPYVGFPSLSAAQDYNRIAMWAASSISLNSTQEGTSLPLRAVAPSAGGRPPECL